ncbi:serine/threonine protein kinase [Dysgonomonas sp. PH5-45]|uniref:serine/threonine-protein kinase n=1 Tax=unclassified Dysgonomonas TaxID=2630389 RepID=UPI002474FC89|nr:MULTISPECIES: serine/threonine-protein kinase [unclassified Dysgonomonas]MDH6354605.1 serine/threonine protein kinase [Dysgonomonas sp. PH5-45]MDH6387503.1 serine/threonine protein kinase [Dysgonomonas sp. PH5-37]
MATEHLDKFQIINHLGNGFFGDVYLCFDPFLQKEIAVKVIKVPNPTKFVQAVKEGQALDICRHKHIVDVKDVRATLFHAEPVVIIVMEYLSKGSIQKHIEKRFISAKESCKIIQQSLLGLEHAHNNNILHRDVKPGNIMFGDSGEAKLSDFGLAINYHSDPSDIMGYKPHQPLEVIEGQPMDKLSDIYAMGVTFYRLLNNTNNLPFTFSTKEEWMKAVKKDLFPSRVFLPHIPEKVIKILNKAIHKKKNSRFQNCTVFRQSIEKLNFNIDWFLVDTDNWTGINDKDNYALSKYRKRTGWVIDFKKNGIRKTENCYIGLPDDKVENEFFKVIRETSLK